MTVSFVTHGAGMAGLRSLMITIEFECKNPQSTHVLEPCAQLELMFIADDRTVVLSRDHFFVYI